MMPFLLAFTLSSCAFPLSSALLPTTITYALPPTVIITMYDDDADDDDRDTVTEEQTIIYSLAKFYDDRTNYIQFVVIVVVATPIFFAVF